MRIDGPIQFNAARAYGPVAAPANPGKLDAVSTPTSIDRNLVAGQVPPTGADPFQVPNPTQTTPAQAGAPLQMYTSAAEKIEVATKIQSGRNLDVTG